MIKDLTNGRRDESKASFIAGLSGVVRKISTFSDSMAFATIKKAVIPLPLDVVKSETIRQLSGLSM